MSAAWLSVKPVTANSNSPIRLTAELIQCHMWSCFSQKAFRLLLVAGREAVGACIGLRKNLGRGRCERHYRERFSITIRIRAFGRRNAGRRKSVVEGKSLSVRVVLCCSRISQKKNIILLVKLQPS